MSDFSQSKALVRRFYDELDSATDAELAAVLARYCTPDCLWRGMHPFYIQTGPDAAAESFWRPFRRAFRPIQRRMDVFMAGRNHMDGGATEWVASMGHLMGLFDADWLGIPHHRKMAFLRYVEFNRIEGGRIAETALWCDILSVMQQVGLNPLPLQTGAAFLTPGPRTHDGLLFAPQDPAESQKTLDLIHRMIDDLHGSEMGSSQQELARTRHEDMIWFGPAGIGATYTLSRYDEQHQRPFSRHLGDIRSGGHLCRFAEGSYGGFFGWPNLTMQPLGGFMGLPASDRRVEMRVVDVYRRAGDRLAENWIFIDIPYFLYQQGVDVFDRMAQIVRR